MLVSVIINNYNYGRFLKAAIDSALGQTYHPLEVIVVDDGSIDDSWRIIQSYRTRIKAIRQPNGGQGAAYNAGFAASRGEFVLFLDSDDELDTNAIATCMSAVTPTAAKVQFFLRLVNREGARVGGFTPYRMHDGDVKPVLARYGHYSGPPSSGNLYRRSAIERYFPMDAAQWRRAADTIPFICSAFHGEVISVRRSLGNYRLHVQAAKGGIFGNQSKSLGEVLISDEHRRDAVFAWLQRNGTTAPNTGFLPIPTTARSRALSWKLDRINHPYPQDSAWSILRTGTRSVAHWPGYTLTERAAMLTWILLTVLSPIRFAREMSVTHVSSIFKTWVRRVAGRDGIGLQ